VSTQGKQQQDKAKQTSIPQRSKHRKTPAQAQNCIPHVLLLLLHVAVPVVCVADSGFTSLNQYF
jgi:hypothetical protein